MSRLHATVVRQVVEQPPANEVADMLEEIRAGSPDDNSPGAFKDKLLTTIKRLKGNKSGDQKGFFCRVATFLPLPTFLVVF